MKHFNYPGNYAVVALGCKHCPRNIEYEADNRSDIIRQISLIGKFIRCPVCKTPWKLKKMNVLTVALDGQNTCWKAVPEYEPLNLGNGRIKIRLLKMLIPDVDSELGPPSGMSTPGQCDEAETTADVLDRLGIQHLFKNEYRQAIICLKSAIAVPICEQVAPENHVIHIYHLGNAYEAHGKYQKSASLKTALNVYQQALALGKKVFGGRDVRTAEILDSLGNVNCGLGQYASAVTHYKRALVIRQAEKNALALVGTMNNLALAYLALRQYPAVKQLLCRAVSILENEQKTGSCDLAGLLNNYALALIQTGDQEGSIRALERAVQIKEKPPETNKSDLIIFLQNLGGLYAMTGNNTSAELVYQRALRTAELQPTPDKDEINILQREMAAIRSGQFTKKPHELWQVEA